MKNGIHPGLPALLSVFLAVSLTACGNGGGDEVSAFLPIERISVDSNGAQATGGGSRLPSTSSTGQYTAFQSDATNLLVGGVDTNGLDDIFVHDRQTGVTTRVNVGPGGAEATGGPSGNPSISSNGQYVAFASYATNLVPGDTNGLADVFVHDRQRGVTTRVSVVHLTGAQARSGISFDPSISSDGRYVAFWSAATNLLGASGIDTNGLADVFVHDRLTGATIRVSVVDLTGAQATGSSFDPSISADGRYVAFRSSAANLLGAGIDTNGLDDIFVHDRLTGATTRVSVGPGGAQAAGPSDNPSISSDGRYVAFRSSAANLVGAGVDTNGVADVFVRDRLIGVTVRASVDSAGAQAAGGPSNDPSISSDGRYVAFWSDATNLVPGDINGFSDIFVRDRLSGVTRRVNVDSTGAEATGGSSLNPSISSDGRHVAFESDAANLVIGDTNAREDIFIAPNR